MAQAVIVPGNRLLTARGSESACYKSWGRPSFSVVCQSYRTRQATKYDRLPHPHGLIMNPAGPRYFSAATTHQGYVRGNNEDRVYTDDGRGFFLVVDGMGGHEAGSRPRASPSR